MLRLFNPNIIEWNLNAEQRSADALAIDCCQFLFMFYPNFTFISIVDNDVDNNDDVYDDDDDDDYI